MLKALQESDHEPESGNSCDDESGNFEVVDDDNRQHRHVLMSNDDEFDRYSHYFALASMLKMLNSDPNGDGNNGNFLLNDKLID